MEIYNWYENLRVYPDKQLWPRVVWSVVARFSNHMEG